MELHLQYSSEDYLQAGQSQKNCLVYIEESYFDAVREEKGESSQGCKNASCFGCAVEDSWSCGGFRQFYLRGSLPANTCMSKLFTGRGWL